MKNKEYWSKRISEVAQKQFDTTNDEMQKELKAIYEEMAKKMAKEVDDIYFKLLQDEITRTDIWTYKHYRDLSKRMAILAARVGAKEEKILNKQLEIALREVYKSTPLPGAIFALIDEVKVKRLISTPWCGKHFSERIWVNKSNMIEQLKKGVTESIVLGKSKDKAVEEIMKKCNVGFRDADRLVRTELMATINHSQIEKYKDNGYTHVQVLVAGDERTCPECMAYDGKTYKINEAPTIPSHPNCRCSIIPVI